MIVWLNICLTLNQRTCRAFIVLVFSIQQPRPTTHASQLDGRCYRVRHKFCSRTTMALKRSLLLIDFGYLNFPVYLGSYPISLIVVARFESILKVHLLLCEKNFNNSLKLSFKALLPNMLRLKSFARTFLGKTRQFN